LTGWLGSKTSRAPEVLRERVVSFVGEPGPDVELSDRLAGAGGEALQSVLAHGGDRSVALDLLSADALITLALLAQAERDPNRLEAFAADLVRAEPGGSSESTDR
jgi:hypothetical protein